jgi:methionine aminotransferase
VTFASPTPLQEAIADMLGNPAEVDHLLPFYQQKRDAFLAYMKDARFKPLPCQGTYFQLMDYSEISDAPDTEFAITLTRQHGVASIPVSVFYAQPQDRKVLRFCFAKQDETLRQAAEKLCRI